MREEGSRVRKIVFPMKIWSTPAKFLHITWGNVWENADKLYKVWYTCRELLSSCSKSWCVFIPFPLCCVEILKHNCEDWRVSCTEFLERVMFAQSVFYLQSDPTSERVNFWGYLFLVSRLSIRKHHDWTMLCVIFHKR